MDALMTARRRPHVEAMDIGAGRELTRDLLQPDATASPLPGRTDQRRELVVVRLRRSTSSTPCVLHLKGVSDRHRTVGAFGERRAEVIPSGAMTGARLTDGT